MVFYEVLLEGMGLYSAKCKDAILPCSLMV